MIQRIRQEAEQQFRQKERELQERLAQSRAQMESILDREARDNRATLGAEKRAQLDSFRKEMLSVRKELREVQHALRIDLDRLDNWLKFLNIAAIPLLLVGGVVAVTVYRRVRTSASPRSE
jgi:ABC-type uncharacterized transport system involved in gliding motility auxiliary subunit